MKTTRYPEKSIEQQMREQAFRTKQPTDWSLVVMRICFVILLIGIAGIIYCAIKLYH